MTNFFKRIKNLSLENIWVYRIVVGVPFILLGLATYFKLIGSTVFFGGLILWYGAYHPLITGMRRNILSLKKVVAARVEMQDLTYGEISREIHDNINLQLMSALIHLYNYKQITDEKVREEQFTTATTLIRHAVKDLEDLSKSLTLEKIRNDGFYSTLSEEIGKLRLLYNLDLKVKGEPIFLNAEREIQLFRIVQECLKNIIKHAQAKNIGILLEYGENDLEIKVKDDGRGFEYTPKEKRQNGSGLRNIKVRAKILTAKISIKSAPGQGTTIKLLVPYKEIKTSFLSYLLNQSPN